MSWHVVIVGDPELQPSAESFLNSFFRQQSIGNDQFDLTFQDGGDVVAFLPRQYGLESSDCLVVMLYPDEAIFDRALPYRLAEEMTVFIQEGVQPIIIVMGIERI